MTPETTKNHLKKKVKVNRFIAVVNHTATDFGSRKVLTIPNTDTT